MRTCTAGLVSLFLAMATLAIEAAAQERAKEDPAGSTPSLQPGSHR